MQPCLRPPRSSACPTVVAVAVRAFLLVAGIAMSCHATALAWTSILPARRLVMRHRCPMLGARPFYSCRRVRPWSQRGREACYRLRSMSDGWDGQLSQTELMERDECILVDSEDRIIGGASKAASHRRMKRGCEDYEAFRLHRAFSVFLFDESGRLLLQQRAGSKITFPLVWTNTCCSHPLHGQSPSEVDTPEDVASGRVLGAKRAAVRKLGHELGIAPDQLPLDAFKFLTRLHYYAEDATDPEPGEWGEHELDYLLLARVPGVLLRPNPEEVEAVKWVTPDELRAMMAPSSGLKWSPWFRIIADRMLPGWWADLDRALTSDTHADGRIHSLGTR